MSHRSLLLLSQTDFDAFRHHARRMLEGDVAPEDISWNVAGGNASLVFDEAAAESAEALFDETPDMTVARASCGTAENAADKTADEANDENVDGPTDQPSQSDAQISPAGLKVPNVSRAFLTLCEKVILHRNPGRFALLYRLLWRMREAPRLFDDPLDADMMRAQAMARDVRRDMHKMTAFVRFRPIPRPETETLHVAWFEPDNHIVEAIAPFFQRRFAQMHWAILTPSCSIGWDGRTLTTGPGASRGDAPDADAGEALWLTYYAHIFNPARLKLAMMRKEMPRKYWSNLPEAPLIGQLSATAGSRQAHMLAAEATVPVRRIVRPAQNTVTPIGLGRPDAMDMETLREHAQQCRNCSIGEHATQAVWGEGPVDARLMLVGEQPGDREDLVGRPFVGPAGQMLDRALDEIGCKRSELYLTNAVKHFKFEPRGKRRIHKTPSQQEAAACEDWLAREISIVRPRFLVALGATAARALLGRPVAVMRERGRWLQTPQGLQILVTLHPSALLRMGDAERASAYAFWVQDLALAAAAMQKA